MDIAGRTFLITGGASGLGAAAARALVDRGGRVLVVDRDEARGVETTARLGTSAVFQAADVTEEASVAAAVDVAAARFGQLDGVICCAGVVLARRTVGREGPHALDAFRRVLEVNLLGTWNVVRLAVPAMMQNDPGADGERGIVLLTSSVAAFEGQIGQAAYAASKGGVAALTLPLAREFAGVGIRVVSIAPGIFDTPMMGALPDAARASLGQQVPFPSRLGHPSEYAELACHVVENRMLNGTVIRLDGAIRMGPR